MTEMVEAGAQRISVGGSLTWAAVNAMAAAASEIRDHGAFTSLGTSPPLRDWFA
jgi:2-methylisocitrate lyase-like PEP mutase family enzyme